MQFISLYLKHKRSDVVFWLFQSEVAGEWFAVIDLIVNTECAHTNQSH